MDPLLPLTLASVGIAVLGWFRSRLDACSILGASLASALLLRSGMSDRDLLVAADPNSVRECCE